MKVVLIGNYAPDGQESMLRYAELMHDGLLSAGHEVTMAVPRPFLNFNRRPATGVSKWTGYLDKYVLGTGDLKRAVRHAEVVHICDHSNAVYVPAEGSAPFVVTCHDLLAVRGALGEDTDCPASFTGRMLQREILGGLGRAQAVACVSGATLRDATRLLPGYSGELVITPNALNYPYGELDSRMVEGRLGKIPDLRGAGQYVLHIGSNLRRKNREVILLALARIGSSWDGQMVFAGQPLSPELRELAEKLGVAGRIVEVKKPDNELLEALYNGALALFFPSRFEGFGWPIVEAQASGCPVICSDRDPFPEVAGGAAIFCDAEDDAAFGEAVLMLAARPEQRSEFKARGLRNAARYGRAAMIGQFVSLYERVLDRA